MLGVDTHTRSPVRSVSRPPGKPAKSPATPRRRATRRHRPQRLLQPHAHPRRLQYERRSYWAVPDVYHAFSPLLFADRLDRPVLIVHGTDDTNPPTQPSRPWTCTGRSSPPAATPAWSSSPTKASVPVPRVAPGPRPRARTMAAALRRGRHPRYRLSRYPVPAASLTPIGSAWSGRATGRGGARPRPCGG
jgi:hypothetical protein